MGVAVAKSLFHWSICLRDLHGITMTLRLFSWVSMAVPRHHGCGLVRNSMSGMPHGNQHRQAGWYNLFAIFCAPNPRSTASSPNIKYPPIPKQVQFLPSVGQNRNGMNGIDNFLNGFTNPLMKNQIGVRYEIAGLQ